jgi:glyoxylate/hydroxypyruvate reductase A
VLGWGANQKSSLGDIQHFFGDGQLGDFLEKTDILINVLPLTESTTNILRKQELQRLSRGAFIINMGRGGIVNEADLLSLLDEGHITAAAMDVFEEEPLSANNPLWTHPSVYITPHIAGQSNPQSSAKTIAKNIRRLEDGKMPFPIYNITKGYYLIAKKIKISIKIRRSNEH